MKYKEKEKLWLSKIKENKSKDWKFKSWFIFRDLNDFFFSASFYVSLKENKISGYLGYKPMNIDNVFWEIIDEQPNKKMPLSFRGEAAFCVREINFYKFNIEIEDELKPENEIKKLLLNIDKEVHQISQKIKNTQDFRVEMMNDEEENSVGIITSLIEEQKFDEALKKIKEYKENEYNSGFGFGDDDFYDLAKKYIKKTTDNGALALGSNVLLRIKNLLLLK